jgi:xylose isomerase
MMEMMGMTGLSLGEVNKDLQGRIDQIKAESAEKAHIASLDCARALKTYSCSWNDYVAANPAVQLWANKYPSMVPAEKARLRAID